MKYLVLGGSGNLSSVTVLSLLKCEHIVHCITRGNNRKLESSLEKLGATFHHITDFADLATFTFCLLDKYDFVVDFIAYDADDVLLHIRSLSKYICRCYVYISTTAFYKRSSTLGQPFREDNIEVSNSWNYAINKYRAELAFENLSVSSEYKTLIIRLGHTIGFSIPVFLGNPGMAFIDHIRSGKPIPFVGDLDHTWSIGSGFGLSSIISSLPKTIDQLPHHYVLHYSEHLTTWRDLYSHMCSFLLIEQPRFNHITLDLIGLKTPEWLPSIINHKIYPDSYDLSRLARYFPLTTSRSIKDIVEYACIRTLQSGREKSYHLNLKRLALLSATAN